MKWESPKANSMKMTSILKWEVALVDTNAFLCSLFVIPEFGMDSCSSAQAVCCRRVVGDSVNSRYQNTERMVKTKFVPVKALSQPDDYICPWCKSGLPGVLRGYA